MNKKVVLFLLYVIVVLCSGKQIEERKSRLILEFDWPEPKKNLQRFPHAVSCSHFYALRPGVGQVLKKCPNDEFFDYRTLRCRQKASAKCWSDLLKKANSKKKQVVKHFRCPFPWGLFPNTEDCSLFYDCYGGLSYSRKCPDNFLFDKAERTCTAAKEAMCADHKDIVEPNYKCPYKWGFFTHSKDCSKYYECLRKIPNLRTCKKNMLFDNFKRRCLPVRDVECGERFNPYGLDQVTPENKPKDGHQTILHPLEWKETSVDNITTNDKIENLSKIYQDTKRNHIYTNHKMVNELKTSNLSTKRQGKITNYFSTEHPSETTSHFSTGQTSETTKTYSTKRPSEITSHFSTGQTSETTKNNSSKRPSETTSNFHTGQTSKTTENYSTKRPSETTSNFYIGQTSETTENYSTKRPSETTNHFSTGRPQETTSHFTTEHPSKTSNEFSTQRPLETTNQFSTKHPKLSTDRHDSDSESTSTYREPSEDQSETNQHSSTGKLELIPKKFLAIKPKETTHLNSSGFEEIVADIVSPKHE